VVKRIAPPELVGVQDAEVTLVGWGSTYGVINEAVEMLNDRGVSANHLQIKWIVPFHAAAVIDILSHAKRIIMVENNYSGQFARYLRSETGISAHGHIRKYDGEPFMPHHIVNGVMELMGEKTDRYIPYQEVLV
jgi:2-oxoglutarate ferredoxin oxidoreductase subunit alpha